MRFFSPPFDIPSLLWPSEISPVLTVQWLWREHCQRFTNIERHVVIKGWQAREFVKSMEKKISFLVSSSSLRSIGNKSIGFVARFQKKVKKKRKDNLKKMERCYIWEAKWLSLGVCVWMNVNASAYLRGKGCGA